MTETLNSTAGRLAEYVVGTTDADLPTEVVDYGKLVLLDSLICGLAAAHLPRSGTVQRMARRFGGPAEATVFGLPERVASINAVHANAEMMNALDADDTFFNSAHFAVFGVAAALAEGERLRGTGSDLLRASILAFEVNARLNLSTSLMLFDGEQFQYSQLSSHGYAAFGTAAAAAVMGGFDASTLTNAYALAGWLAPTARNTFTAERSRYNSFKYGPYGAIGQAGMTAAAMAQEGYVGDLDVLDREPGFIRAQGYLGTDRSELTAGLGEKWWILDTSLKPYPTCRFTHAAMDAVRNFPAETGVALDEIDSIEIRMSPAAYRHGMFRHPATSIEPGPLAPLNGAFNIPYALAMMLQGIPPGPGWYDEQRLVDPATWAIASRVTTAEDPVLHEEWKRDLAEHPGGQIRRTRGSLTIRAAGRDHQIETDFCLGDPWDDSTRPTVEFLRTKFATFCEGIVSASAQQQLLDAVIDIEQVTDIAAELTPLLQTLPRRADDAR
ncbi:MmgE/PrpD family protein [Nakamurella lactea]|uniref:MmgE/PrpD family protein n=1 Tax=Nakamurella lactea TaxID=459515 RepID=UPI00041F8207|nr:MmgE/PrpD family protein [Nakamurella lactea]